MSSKTTAIITLVWKILGVLIPWLRSKDNDDSEKKESRTSAL